MNWGLFLMNNKGHDCEEKLIKELEDYFHNLANHLATINGFAHVLANNLETRSDEKDFAQKILQSGEDATKLSVEFATFLKTHFENGQ